MGFFADKDSDESGMMQMADDQSEVSGIMQQINDDEQSELTIGDLGTATKAPIIRDRASDDSVQDFTVTTGSAGHDFRSAKQKARQFNALSVSNMKT